MTPDIWYREYLAARGIAPEAAEKYGVRLVSGDVLTSMGWGDGYRMEAAIVFPDGQIKPFRPRVKADWGNLSPEASKKVRAAYEKSHFGGEWKRRCTGDTEQQGIEPGIFEWRGGLVKLKESGELEAVSKYPAVRFDIDGVEQPKLLYKPGHKMTTWAPEPVKGGRPLVVVEGKTRVLACLAAGSAARYDVVSVDSCRVSQDVIEELQELALKATYVVVVMDGDWITNDQVLGALVGFVTNLRRIESGIDDNGEPIYKNLTVRVGVVDGGKSKAGLDDFLAANPGSLVSFLDDCLPADPLKALEVLKRERFSCREDEIAIHSARTADPTIQILRLQEWQALGPYENLRRKLKEYGSCPKHPAPEGRLVRPSAEDIAMITADYIAPHIPFVVVGDGMGQPRVYEAKNKILQPRSEVAALPAIQQRLSMLLDKTPTVGQSREAWGVWKQNPTQHDVTAIRWVGEDRYAMAEVPEPVDGPMPAMEEFLGRLSCRDTFLAWWWTLFLPEAERGRQALFNLGEGHVGKSAVWKMMWEALGGATSEVCQVVTDIKGEDKFAFARLTRYTRLVVLDDVRNPNILHYKDVRNLIAGGPMQTQDKYTKAVTQYLHPGMLIISNRQLKIDIHNAAEASRVLQVNVAPTAHSGDKSWPVKIAAELPHFLWAAREAYGRLYTGKSIAWTEATRKVMGSGSEESLSDFDLVLERLDFSPQHRCSIRAMSDLLASKGIVRGRGYGVENFSEVLTNRGCVRGQARIDRKTAKCWIGVAIKNENES